MFILDKTNSIASQFIAELRDVELQKDRMRFRKNLERIGEIMAYEISKTFDYIPQMVTTPLGQDPSMFAAESPVLIGIMRAGLPFHIGFLNYFDRADNGFVGAFRQEDGDSLEIMMHYMATPDIQDKTIILIDPMLATGSSLVKTYNALLKNGTPKKVHIAAVIAAAPGVEKVMNEIPEAEIWAGAVDAELNDQFFIVPGLGDAGDLAFGLKL